METTKKEKGFLLYQRWKRQFERLTMEQRGLLITAIFECDETGETPDCEDPAVGMALDFIAEQLAHDRQKYADKCEKNRRNAAKSHTGKGKGDASEEGLQARGGDRLQTVANGSERMRSEANGSLSDSDSESESDSDSDSDSLRERNAHTREGRGKYKNVRLADAEYDELQREIHDLDGQIEQLSSYMQSSGKRYEDHAATLRLWAARERKKRAHEPVGSLRNAGGFDTDEFFEAALARGDRYGSDITDPPPPPKGASPP